MELSKRYANFVRVGSDGYVGIYDASQNRMMFLNTGNAVIFTQDNGALLSVNYKHGTFNGFSNTQIYIDGPAPVIDGTTFVNAPMFFGYNNSWGIELAKSGFHTIRNIGLSMYGVGILSGSPDLRTGITAADASPITIFSSTVSGTRYEVKARILATSGSSATYTISWTEGGVVQKVALTITAVDTEVHDNFVIAPDANTNITAQITALTSSTVNVDAIVSVLG